MLTAKRIDGSVHFNPDGIEEPIIGVRILVLPGPGDRIVFPEQNRIGTEILCRLLQAQMELAGVHVTEAYFGFPFNQAYYQFAVSELGLGRETVKEELEKLRLLCWAQIAWRDPREEVWRLWHSKSTRFESPSSEEFAVEREFLAAVRKVLEELQQSQDEHPSQ